MYSLRSRDMLAQQAANRDGNRVPLPTQRLTNGAVRRVALERPNQRTVVAARQVGAGAPLAPSHQGNRYGAGAPLAPSHQGYQYGVGAPLAPNQNYVPPAHGLNAFMPAVYYPPRHQNNHGTEFVSEGKINPPIFLGRPGDSFDAFVTSYEGYCAIKGHDNARKLAGLAWSLRDFAHDIFVNAPRQNHAAITAAIAANAAIQAQAPGGQAPAAGDGGQGQPPLQQIPAAVDHTYATMMAYLRTQFTTASAPNSAWDRFFNRRQLTGEDVSAFYYELSRLVIQVGASVEEREKMLKAKLETATLPHVRSYLASKKSVNLTVKQILADARDHEGYYGLSNLPDDSSHSATMGGTHKSTDVLDGNFYNADWAPALDNGDYDPNTLAAMEETEQNDDRLCVMEDTFVNSSKRMEDFGKQVGESSKGELYNNLTSKVDLLSTSLANIASRISAPNRPSSAPAGGGQFNFRSGGGNGQNRNFNGLRRDGTPITCFNCGGAGHISRFCSSPAKLRGSKQANVQNSAPAQRSAPAPVNNQVLFSFPADGTIMALHELTVNTKKVKKLGCVIDVVVEGIPCKALFDTSAAMSVIRTDIWEQLGSPSLESSKINCKTIDAM